MNYSNAYAVIVSTVQGFGLSALAILTALVAVAVGLLVFRFGWKKTSEVAGYRVGTEDEYPKRFRDAFIANVDRYNRSHPM